jgi:hypothetical protein
MPILIDGRMPLAAKEKLREFGEIFEFATEGITYEAISGHPDIFFCPTPNGLVVAPNLPEKYFDFLHKFSISYTIGENPVGKFYPDSAIYNSLVTNNLFIHNPTISDATIQKLAESQLAIKVKQGYVRCNLLVLPNNRFITSDKGIEKTLRQNNFEVLFVDSTCVKLPGYDHGFFGGICGINEMVLFVNGSLSYFKEEEDIRNFIAKANIRIVELFDGQPIDVGTILFL